MEKILVDFSIYQLIISDSPFDINIFNFNFEEFFDYKNHTERYRVIRKIEENKFVTIYFNGGKKYPYSGKIINNNFEISENKRSSDEFEMSEQLFVLIDVYAQRLLMSDQRKKSFLIDWLEENIEKNIILKSIIQEDDFIEKIRSIDRISFSVEPDLFNSSSEDVLSNNLVRDIFGFGAEKAKIEFNYKNVKICDHILSKLKFLMNRKYEFRNLVVVGRDEKNLESIFNLKNIINKISIKVKVDENSRLMNEEIVFRLLINEIKEYEENI